MIIANEWINPILSMAACLAIAEYLNIKLDFRPRWYARAGFAVGGVMLWVSAGA